MPIKDGKVLPDYQVVDGIRVLACFSPQSVRDTINFKPKPGDIFLATYPKCGTTWTQQIILLLLNDAKPLSNAKEFLTKCPYLEFTGVDPMEHLPEPRLAKIHLPFHLAPYSAEAKYVFVFRNPKDCLVSFYHHTRTAMYDFVEGKFEDYFELFINGDTDYGDYFDHVLSWYQQRDKPNILFVHYEDMKKDIKTSIIRIGTFLGPKYKALVENPQKLADLIQYSSFEYMKKHVNEDMSELNDLCMNPETDIDKLPLPSGMKFFMKYMRARESRTMSDFQLVRKGIVGDWRANFTDDQNRRMDKKIEEKMKDCELLDYWKGMKCL